MVEQHETLITINQGKGQRAPRMVSPVQLHLIGGTFFATWHLLSRDVCSVSVLICACVRVYVCVWAVWNSSGLTFNLLLSEPSAISTHQEVIQVLVLLGLPEGWCATCSLIKLLLRLKIFIHTALILPISNRQMHLSQLRDLKSKMLDCCSLLSCRLTFKWFKNSLFTVRLHCF